MGEETESLRVDVGIETRFAVVKEEPGVRRAKLRAELVMNLLS